MITSSSSSEHSDGTIRTCKRKQKRHPEERALQILDGHPGIMELIGNYVGVIRGKELRMLTEFHELVIEYLNTDDSSSSCSSDDDYDNDSSEDEE